MTRAELIREKANLCALAHICTNVEELMLLRSASATEILDNFEDALVSGDLGVWEPYIHMSPDELYNVVEDNASYVYAQFKDF